MHEILVNGIGGLSLPRKSVVRLTDCPYMTLDVYRGRKTAIHQYIISLRRSRIYEGQWKQEAKSGELYTVERFRLIKNIFSSAVFEENLEVLSLPWCRAKTLTFSNISVITEDIYLKLRVIVCYQKGNPFQKGK